MRDWYLDCTCSLKAEGTVALELHSSRISNVKPPRLTGKTPFSRQYLQARWECGSLQGGDRDLESGAWGSLLSPQRRAQIALLPDGDKAT